MSLHSNAAANYAQRTTGTFLDPSGNFTICSWVKVDDVPATAPVYLYRCTDGSNVRFQFDIRTNGQLGFYVTTDNGSTEEEVLIEYIVGKCYHLAVVYTASTDTFTFFVEGLLIGSVITDITAATFTSEFLLRGTGATSFDVNIQYLRVWQRALTQSEVQAVMNSKTLGASATDLFYNIPALTDLLDTSGNSRDFVAVASPDFESTIALADCRIGMGGSFRQLPFANQNWSGQDSHGPFYLRMLDSGLQIMCTVNLCNFGDPNHNQTQGALPDAVQLTFNWALNLGYRNVSTPAYTALINPFPNPLMGLPTLPLSISSPARSTWPWYRFALFCKTATWDILNGAWIDDGTIEFTLDEVSLYSASSLAIRNRFSAGPLLSPRYFDGGGDMDGIWLLGNNVAPTLAGAQHVPTSRWLLAYFNFNDAVIPPTGWNTFSMQSGSLGVPAGGAANSGLDDTQGMSGGTTDPDTTVYWGAPTTTFGVYNNSALYKNFILGILPADEPAGTGSIVVTKVTNPAGLSQVFEFEAGGGLDPTSFTLSHGESQEFEDVPVGSVYSIAETVPAGWTMVADVSNGTLENIVVEADTTTTVAFTNTPVAFPNWLGSRVTRYPRRLIRSPIISANGNYVRVKRLQLDFQPGMAAPPVGVPRDVMLRVSNDGGNTWSSFRVSDPGDIGQYLARVQWWQVGFGRAIIIEEVDHLPNCLVTGWLDAEECQR